jgi:predicted alpha/beta-fold hydrolase
MIKAATLNGFKCVTVNFRGAAGIPLTSPKIYWLCNWEDIKEPIDYIHQKYCSGDSGSDYEQRNMYGYGVSLGSSMLTLYLINEGTKSPLKGSLGWGTPFSMRDNVPFFKSNGMKFYDFSMGYNFYLILKSKIAELVSFRSKEELIEFE